MLRGKKQKLKVLNAVRLYNDRKHTGFVLFNIWSDVFALLELLVFKECLFVTLKHAFSLKLLVLCEVLNK